ncbi:Ig-like domain-containing protein, partial [Candidatus Uhrbacteria bacterium]|nr:Ig-like domain-containing protein [Candidatus Uhrbacteria bacterium]
MSQTTAFRLLRDIGVKRTAIAALIFMFILGTFMTVSPFGVDAAAPSLTMAGWKDAQTKIVVEFDDAVHDGAGGPLTAADFTLAGAQLGTFSISGVEHEPGSELAVIILSENLNSAGGTGLTITCAASSVFNMANQACASSPVNVYTSIAEDTTGPAVQALEQVSPTSVYVMFDEVIDPSTAIAGNFTLTTADGGDNSAITLVHSFIEGVYMEASAAVIAPGSGNTLAVNTSVTDVFGNASAGETVMILPSIKISEIKVADTTNSKSEFIELYNISPQSVDVSNLKLHIWDGTTDTNLSLTLFNTVIPPNGFYLIAPSTFVAASGAFPDATYQATNAIQLVSNGAAYISYHADADTDVVDLVGWGTSTKKEGTVLADIAAGTSVERKSSFGATAASMTGQGPNVFSGNGNDDKDNLSDFVVQSTPYAQDSFFPTEFPFGAEFNSGGDTVLPTVVDSFPSSSNSAFVPTDMMSAGVDFSESMNPGTLTTSTVSLYADSDPGTNLCTSVQYDPQATFGAQVTCVLNPAAQLAAAAHTFKVTTGAQDTSQNGLATDYIVNFTPSSNFTFSSQSAPDMVGSFPGPNTASFPPNGEFININFNQSLLAASLTGNVTLQNLSQNTTETITGMSLISVVDSNDAIELDVSGVTFTASENYLVTISTGVTSADGVAIPMAFTIPFTVSGSNDSTGPVVGAKYPAAGATGVSVGDTNVYISMNEALNSTSVSTATVQLLDPDLDILPINVSYDPDGKQIELFSTMAFSPSTQYTIRLFAAGSGGPIKNVSGLDLVDDDGNPNNYYEFSFTTGGADATAPTAGYATATQNQIDVTFEESMLASTVTNLSNWSLESPVGTNIPLSAMAGNAITWDPGTKTAKLAGFTAADGASFQITASTSIKDMAGNALAVPAVLGGTVLDVGIYGSNIGPGAGFIGDVWDMPAAFSTNDFGFVPQAGVWPQNNTAGVTTNYNFNFPISEQIRSHANGGKVVVTFPAGFDVTNAIETVDHMANADSNWQSPGVVNVNSVTANASARTVTVNFGVATRCGGGNTDPCVSGDEQDFIEFNISGIVNTSVPRDWETAGYTLDIKTMTAGTLLETMTSMPFNIISPGAHQLDVAVTAGVSNTGIIDVHIFSPGSGEVVQALDFSGSGGTKTASFTGLQEDYYDVWTESVLDIDSVEYAGIKNETVWVTGTVNAPHTLASTAALQAVTVNVTGATGKDIDVFVSGPTGFQVKRIASTTGTDSVTMKLGDGDWNFGIGPHMNMKDMTAMMVAPDYKVTPNWAHVRIDGATVTEDNGNTDGAIDFALTTAAFTAPIKVVDTNGNPIVDAIVYMDDTKNGFGTSGNTATTGIATLPVDQGTYRVGAFLPGAPPTGEVKVKVGSTGNLYKDGSTVAVATIVIQLSKADTVISGTVTDGTNTITGAGVHAFCTANCSGYFDAGSMTNANGKYTLYVGNGTWNVEAFIPGYGPTAQTTVTISGADATVNLRPDAAATFYTISGKVCRDGDSTAPCNSTHTMLAGIEVFAWSSDSGG